MPSVEGAKRTGKKMAKRGRPRKTDVTRDGAAVLNLQEGLAVVEFDPETDNVVPGSLQALLTSLPRRTAERVVALYLEYPDLDPHKSVDAANHENKGGRPRRPTAQELGRETAQQWVKDGDGRPRKTTVFVVRDPHDLDPTAPEPPSEVGSSESGAMLKSRQARVRAHVRALLAKPERLADDIWDTGPLCECSEFWTHFIYRKYPPAPYWNGAFGSPYVPGSHPPCDDCGRAGEGYYIEGDKHYCDKCIGRIRGIPEHQHCEICGATSSEIGTGIHPLAWVNPITLELDHRGWFCAYCWDKFNPRGRSQPMWFVEPELDEE